MAQEYLNPRDHHQLSFRLSGRVNIFQLLTGQETPQRRYHVDLAKISSRLSLEFWRTGIVLPRKETEIELWTAQKWDARSEFDSPWKTVLRDQAHYDPTDYEKAYSESGRLAACGEIIRSALKEVQANLFADPIDIDSVMDRILDPSWQISCPVTLPQVSKKHSRTSHIHLDVHANETVLSLFVSDSSGHYTKMPFYRCAACSFDAIWHYSTRIAWLHVDLARIAGRRAPDLLTPFRGKELDFSAYERDASKPRLCGAAHSNSSYDWEQGTVRRTGVLEGARQLLIREHPDRLAETGHLALHA